MLLLLLLWQLQRFVRDSRQASVRHVVCFVLGDLLCRMRRLLFVSMGAATRGQSGPSPPPPGKSNLVWICSGSLQISFSELRSMFLDTILDTIFLKISRLRRKLAVYTLKSLQYPNFGVSFLHVLTPFVDNGSVFSLFLKNFAIYTRFVAKMLVGPSLENFLAAPMSP